MPREAAIDPSLALPPRTQSPCPWCGHAPTIEPLAGGWPRKRMLHCTTRTCPVRPAVLAPDLVQAIERWDRRMSEAAAPMQGLCTVADIEPQDIEAGAREMFALNFPGGCWETVGRQAHSTHRAYLDRAKACLVGVLRRRRGAA